MADDFDSALAAIPSVGGTPGAKDDFDSQLAAIPSIGKAKEPPSGGPITGQEPWSQVAQSAEQQFLPDIPRTAKEIGSALMQERPMGLSAVEGDIKGLYDYLQGRATPEAQQYTDIATSLKSVAADPEAAIKRAIGNRPFNTLLTGASIAAPGAMALRGARTLETAATTDAIENAAATNFQASKASGLQIAPHSTTAMSFDVRNAAEAEGLDPFLHPKASRVMQIIDGDSMNPNDMTQVHAMRRKIGAVTKSIDPDERRIGYVMKDKFDDWFNDLDNTDTLGGHPAVAVQQMQDGIAQYAVAKKSELLDDMVQRATDKAGGWTGPGFQNALTAEAKRFVTGNKFKFFSPDEQEAIRRISNGTLPSNFARWVSRLAPMGIVSGAGDILLGGHFLHGYAAPLMAAGVAGRQVGSALIGRAAEQASELVRSRAPGVAPTITQTNPYRMAPLATYPLVQGLNPYQQTP